MPSPILADLEPPAAFDAKHVREYYTSSFWTTSERDMSSKGLRSRHCGAGDMHKTERNILL